METHDSRIRQRLGDSNNNRSRGGKSLSNLRKWMQEQQQGNVSPNIDEKNVNDYCRNLSPNSKDVDVEKKEWTNVTHFTTKDNHRADVMLDRSPVHDDLLTTERRCNHDEEEIGQKRMASQDNDSRVVASLSPRRRRGKCLRAMKIVATQDSETQNPENGDGSSTEQHGNSNDDNDTNDITTYVSTNVESTRGNTPLAEGKEMTDRYSESMAMQCHKHLPENYEDDKDSLLWAGGYNHQNILVDNWFGTRWDHHYAGVVDTNDECIVHHRTDWHDNCNPRSPLSLPDGSDFLSLVELAESSSWWKQNQISFMEEEEEQINWKCNHEYQKSLPHSSFEDDLGLDLNSAYNNIDDNNCRRQSQRIQKKQTMDCIRTRKCQKKRSEAATENDIQPRAQQQACILALSKEDRQRYELMMELQPNEITEAVKHITIPSFVEVLRQCSEQQKQIAETKKLKSLLSSSTAQKSSRDAIIPVVKKRNKCHPTTVTTVHPKTKTTDTPKVKKKKRGPTVPVHPETTTTMAADIPTVKKKKICPTVPKVRKKKGCPMVTTVHSDTTTAVAGNWIDELSRRIASYIGAVADDHYDRGRGYRPPVTPASGDHHQRSFLTMLQCARPGENLHNSQIIGLSEPASTTEINQDHHPPIAQRKLLESIPLLPCLTPHSETYMPTNTTPRNSENHYPSTQMFAWPSSQEVLLRRDDALMREPSTGVSSNGQRPPSSGTRKENDKEIRMQQCR